MRIINWSPYATNPLDYVGSDNLVDFYNEPVRITRDGMDFIVTIGDKRTVTGSNLNTCYFLNVHVVSWKE